MKGGTGHKDKWRATRRSKKLPDLLSHVPGASKKKEMSKKQRESGGDLYHT